MKFKADFFLFLSPAYPAFMLLFGLMFLFASANLVQVQWHPSITAGFYTVACIWVLMLVAKNTKDIIRLNIIDSLALALLALITTSIALHGNFDDLIDGPPRYIPFLMIAPYLCGKLMGRHDIAKLARISIYSSIPITLYLAANHNPILDQDGRLLILGLKHGYLLVGNLLAVTILALCLQPDNKRAKHPFAHYFTAASIIYLATISCFMVWTSARGWLISMALGFLIILFFTLRTPSLPKNHLSRIAFAIVIAIAAFTGSTDSRSFSIEAPAISSTPTKEADSGPILGPSSCKPIHEKLNSVEIRWVIYKEAAAQFLASPFSGNGANLFGLHSCLGRNGFPHSTVLQAFAELGLAGGMIITALYLLGIKTIIKSLPTNKPARNNHSGPSEPENNSSSFFLLSLITIQFISDQIYGNYFMMAGSYLILGMTSGLRNATSRLQ